MKRINVVLLVMVTILLTSCWPLLERVTVAYGTILDQDGMPVDIILVVMDGGKGFKSDLPIGETYSNKQGFYEVVVDVPKGLWRTSVRVDLYNLSLPRNSKKYEHPSGGSGGGGLSIGLRSRYDFKVIKK